MKSISNLIKNSEYIAYDCETTGLSKHSEVIGFSLCVSEDEAFYVILQAWNPVLQILEPKPYLNEARELIMQLQNKKLIMHNSVYDCMLAEFYFKVRLIDSVHTDTMILAHLLNENRRIGLKDLAKEYFGEDSVEEQKLMKASIINNGGKITKGCYELYKGDADLIARYGAKDALLTFKLFNQLVPELFEQGLDKFFYDDESMPLLRGPTYEMNTTGLQVDTVELTRLEKTLEAECEEAKAFIHKEILPQVAHKYPGTNKKNTFNMNAPQQLSWLLFGELRLEFNTLSKVGKNVCRELGIKKLPYTKFAKQEFIDTCLRQAGQIYQPEARVNGKIVKAKKFKEPWAYIACDKQTLAKLAPRYKWIAALLQYKRKQKLIKTYVKGIKAGLQYGVIQPNFLQAGTKTGRYSCRNPNFQNLPRNDQSIKNCIVARPGKVFVIADYSQLEPRIFAYYSKDPRLMNAFTGETDFYSVAGMETFDITDALPIKEGDPEAFGVKYAKLRHMAKEFVLATAYGATAYQLAPKLGKSIDDMQEIMARYLEKFEGVKTMMLEAHDLVKKQGFVQNLFGRYRRLPDALNLTAMYGNQPHAELPYEARRLLNMACNQRIQSTGASLINRAAIAFDKTKKIHGLDAKIVSAVHDELIIECRVVHAAESVKLLQNCMETTNILEGVALEAIPRISKTLAK